jgi:aryl-alcohol dehydrogenase-like predicted oxidoreductase
MASGVTTFDRVSVIGLGCLALDNRPGAAERAESTVRAALDAGVTLLDTADSYGDQRLGPAAAGTNEARVGNILRRLGARDEVIVATKVGHTRTDDGGWGIDGSAGHIHRGVDASLRRLGASHIDLYQHHRPDPKLDYAESMGALREIYDAGKARMIGISNANADQIHTAHSMLGDALVSVQNQYSPSFRSSEPEIELCEELGLTFLAWSPFGGVAQAGALGEQHGEFGAVATELGVSPQQVCLAWMMQRSKALLPIPGASRPGSVTDSAQAVRLELSDHHLERLG